MRSSTAALILAFVSGLAVHGAPTSTSNTVATSSESGPPSMAVAPANEDPDLHDPNTKRSEAVDPDTEYQSDAPEKRDPAKRKKKKQKNVVAPSNAATKRGAQDADLINDSDVGYVSDAPEKRDPAKRKKKKKQKNVVAPPNAATKRGAEDADLINDSDVGYVSDAPEKRDS